MNPGAPIASGPDRVPGSRLVLSSRSISDLVSRLRVGQLVEGHIGARLAADKHVLHLMGQNVVAESAIDFTRGDRVFALVKEIGHQVVLQLVDEQEARRRRKLSDKDISDLLLKLGLPRDKTNAALARKLFQHGLAVNRDEIEALRRQLQGLGWLKTGDGAVAEMAMDAAIRLKKAGLPLTNSFIRPLVAFYRGFPEGLAALLAPILGPEAGDIIPGEKTARLLATLQGRLQENGLNPRGDTAPEALRGGLALLGLGLEQRLRRQVEPARGRRRPVAAPAPDDTVKALLLRLAALLGQSVGDSGEASGREAKASPLMGLTSEAVDYLNGLVLSGEVERGRDGDSVLNAEWLALVDGQPLMVRLGVAVGREKGELKAIDARNVRFGLMVDTTRLGRVTALVDIQGGLLSGRLGVAGPEFADYINDNMESLKTGLEKIGYRVAGLVCRSDGEPIQRRWPDWLAGEAAGEVRMFDVVV